MINAVAPHGLFQIFLIYDGGFPIPLSLPRGKVKKNRPHALKNVIKTASRLVKSVKFLRVQAVAVLDDEGNEHFVIKA